MSNKKYNYAVVLGRFQILHNGHKSLIDEALSLANKVVVLVGSADKSNEKENPFTFDERKEMIESIFDNVIVLPIYDLGVGNVYKWGDYLIDTIKKEGITPNLFVFGDEAKVDLWFRPEIKEEITIKKISRNLIDISATSIRESIINGDKELFLKYCPNALLSYYDLIKERLISIENR